MKVNRYIFGLVLIFVSCKTYTIQLESFEYQLVNAKRNQMSEVEINNPLFFGNLKYAANNIITVNVIDKKGNKLTIPNSPSLEMRLTHKNGKKFHFYFDTIILEKGTLIGSRSRFVPNLTRSIPMDSIVKIEIQDGGKNFKYQN